jgi:hypothetical protein
MAAEGESSPLMIRFVVEERHLTDTNGRPVAGPAELAFHTFEAENIDAAVGLYMTDGGAELIGDVLKFPGFQAVATIRKPSGVYTVQFTPASQGFRL